MAHRIFQKKTPQELRCSKLQRQHENVRICGIQGETWLCKEWPNHIPQSHAENNIWRHILIVWWKNPTCAGPQATPTMCLESNPGRAVGWGLVILRVSKCWHWSLLPQLYTSLSSVSAKQCVDPAATSITFFPGQGNRKKWWQ